MATNPILEEIHKTREQLAQKQGNDLKAICQNAQQSQLNSGHRLVHFSPNLVLPNANEKPKAAPRKRSAA